MNAYFADLSSNREVKPIFLRSLAAQKAHEEPDRLVFPNFQPGEIADNRPILEKSKNPPREPLRFNEEFAAAGAARKKTTFKENRGIGSKLRNFARPDLLQDIASPQLLKNMALHGNLLSEREVFC